MSRLSEAIRARRKELGLTLEQVADAVGVTQGALSHVESGRRLPDPRNALAVAEALQMDPDELLALLDEAHAERRASRLGRSVPSDGGASASQGPARGQTGAYRAMPIGMMFSAAGQAPRAAAGADLRQLRILGRVGDGDQSTGTPPARERVRFSESAEDRLRAMEELADEAARAIRTLRGMLGDEDPALAREARRLLRELDVRNLED